MLTRKEINKRKEESLQNMTNEEYREGYTQMISQRTPRTKLHHQWHFFGMGTPVEMLEYELHDARKLARTYRFASLMVVIIALVVFLNRDNVSLNLPDWFIPVLAFIGGVIITVSIFLKSSANDIHYALEAEQELEEVLDKQQS